MNDALEKEFLAKYQDTPPITNYLTATPQQMEAMLAVIVTAIARCRFARLTDAQRKLMAGNITPGQREVALAAIDVLTLRPDLCQELGFTGADVQENLDMDIEFKSFLDACARAGQALRLAMAMLNGTAGALNAQALLQVAARLEQLEADGDQQGYDRLWAIFEQAFEVQQAPAQGGKKGPSGQLKQHVGAVQQQLDQATADATVLRAVQDILAARPAPAATPGGATVPAPAPGQPAVHVLPARGPSSPAPKGKGTGKKNPGGTR